MATPSDTNEWESCISSIELGTGPLHFCSKRLIDGNKATAKCDGGNFSSLFPGKVCFEFVCTNDSVPGVDAFYRNARNAVERFDLLKILETSEEISVFSGYAFSPSDCAGSYRKSFLVLPSLPYTNETERFVVSVAKEFKQAVYIKYEVEADTVYKKTISLTTGQEVANCTLVQVVPPENHPVLAHPANHSIFQSRNKVEKILSKELHLKGIDELWKIATPLLGWDEDRVPPLHGKNPVIVIEGLDGTGKSLLCDKLSKAINASLLGSPPKCITHLRHTFDAYPPMIRRAYYSLGNYLAAHEIMGAAETRPVVVDRFWHSSAAYAIATEIGSGGSDQLPRAGHLIYQWPQDLPKPDLVVLLVVRPEIRLQRIRSRGDMMTEEEKRIERSRDFQERVLESYKRMQEPGLLVVDASGTPDQVLQTVIHLLQSKGLVGEDSGVPPYTPE